MLHGTGEDLILFTVTFWAVSAVYLLLTALMEALRQHSLGDRGRARMYAVLALACLIWPVTALVISLIGSTGRHRDAIGAIVETVRER